MATSRYLSVAEASSLSVDRGPDLLTRLRSHEGLVDIAVVSAALILAGALAQRWKTGYLTFLSVCVATTLVALLEKNPSPESPRSPLEIERTAHVLRVSLLAGAGAVLMSRWNPMAFRSVQSLLVLPPSALALMPHTSRLDRAAKRALDVCLAAIGLLPLVVLTPLLAIVVKLSSPGPVFFSQRRVGKNGRTFRIYKFRTMYADAPRYGYSPKANPDPRVTCAGRMLRRSKLDELPQLINVLLGQMSLVGPRPEMPFIVERYTAVQRERLALTPGITGLWQISEHRTAPIHEHLEYDFYYAEHRSLLLDLAILCRTALCLVGRN